MNSLKIKIGKKRISAKEAKKRREEENPVYHFQYLEYVKKWLNYSLKVIGGCCGTTPEYIKLISDFLKQKNF